MNRSSEPAEAAPKRQSLSQEWSRARGFSTLFAAREFGVKFYRYQARIPVKSLTGHEAFLLTRTFGDEGRYRFPKGVRPGMTLYGFQQARAAIQRLRSVVVVEGAADVIACHRAGLTNVVGSFTSGLTAVQRAILEIAADEAVLWWDGDDAGMDAGALAARLRIPAAWPRLCR